MKKYEKYKESGIQWIGAIPKSWSCAKLNLFSEIITGNTPSMKSPEFYDANKGIPWVKPSDLVGFNEINESTDYLTDLGILEARIVKKGSVLIGGIGDIGKLGVAGCDLTTNQQIHAVEPNEKKLLSSYLKYVMFSSKEELTKDSTSVVLSILSKSKLQSLKIPIPPLSEQTQIAAYLDHHTALVDALIAKKTALLEKLKLQRQAIINEAVSQGLDAGVKMKDSGVEWLGEVPEGWEVLKLKYVALVSFSSVDRHEYEEELKVLICHYPQAYKNEKIHDENQLSSGTCTEAEFEKFQLKKDQVIITKDSESAQDIGVPTYITRTFKNAVCGYHLAMLETNENKLIGEFLFRFLQTKKVQGYFETNANGVTRFGLGKASIENIEIPVPPIQSQRNITTYINSKLDEISRIIELTNTAIDKLKSYRQSLISEAVTGKIDVRGWEKNQ